LTPVTRRAAWHYVSSMLDSAGLSCSFIVSWW
jgi:hypothetical protein